MMISISWLLALVAIVDRALCRSSPMQKIGGRARPRFIAAVAPHRFAERADRGDLHRSRDRQGVRAAGRNRRTLPRDQRRALRGGVRRAVHVEPHAAGHDVPRQHPVRARRRRRRPTGRAGAITVGDVQAFIQYSRQFSMPLTQLASNMNVLNPASPRSSGSSSSSTPKSRARRPCRRTAADAVTRTRRVPRRVVLLRPRRARSSRTSRSSPSPVRRSRSSDRPAPARPRSSTSSCGSTSSTAARSSSTATTSPTCRARSCGRASAWCCKTRGSSAARSATTSPTASRAAPTKKCIAAAKATFVDRFVQTLARRLRLADQRRGRQHQRRSEAVAHHRPRLPGRPRHPDPRRSHSARSTRAPKCRCRRR